MSVYDFPRDTFGFIFLTREPEDIPGQPRSHVYITSSSRHDYRGVSPDLMFITPDCVSFREFEHEVERLKRELDEITARARQKYDAAQRDRVARKSN